MRIFLVRHGQTQHNVERRIQGPLLDDELNEHGFAQAARLEQRFAQERANGLRLAAVYASPLKRAWLTAEALARGAGVPKVERIDALTEFSWGIYLGKREDEGILDAMKRAHQEWTSGNLHYAPPEGESPSLGWERVKPLLDELMRGHAGEDVALVAHGRINKILLSGLLDDDLRRMDAYPQGNTAVTLLERPDDEGPWRLVYVNDQAHLLGLEAPKDIPSQGPDSPLV